MNVWLLPTEKIVKGKNTKKREAIRSQVHNFLPVESINGKHYIRDTFSLNVQWNTQNPHNVSQVVFLSIFVQTNKIHQIIIFPARVNTMTFFTFKSFHEFT